MWSDDSLQSADKDQQESRAVAEKPNVRRRFKIRHVSKFTAASNGFPCDSAAFLYCYYIVLLGLLAVLQSI